MSKLDRSSEAAERGATVYPYSQAVVPPAGLLQCPDCGEGGLVYKEWWTGRTVHLVRTKLIAELNDPASWGPTADQAMVLGGPDCIHDCALQPARA